MVQNYDDSVIYLFIYLICNKVNKGGNCRNNIRRHCNVLVLYKFASSQVKRDSITGIIDFVYVLPRNLPNNLKAQETKK